MRRCLTALCGAIGCLIGCLAATQAAAERRVALVIGNGQYAHTPALPNPRNDAEDIAEALKKLGFEVMTGFDLDQIRFARLIEDFVGAVEGADVGLFFYAGHGLQINERNYLVSTEARLESTFLVPSETIELNAIIQLMEAKAETNLIFLDACRNNPLTENLKRNLEAINRTVSVGRGLARIEPTGSDTLIAFSAAPGQEAADGHGRNSPFTASLLRHLPTPGLEVSVMLKEVAADVRKDTNNAQRPQQLSDMSKTFFFVKGAPEAAPPPVPAEPGDPVDVAFWQSASVANECESIRAYLRRFPAGRFVDLAEIAARRLCRSSPEIALAALQAPAAVTPVTPSPLDASAGATTNIAVVTPATAPQPAALTSPPAAAMTDAIDIGRKLQRELSRVGCAVSGMENDGTWGRASRNALRSFNARTRSAAEIDRPTPEALEAVQSRKDRVCPVACAPGTELHGTGCIPVSRDRSPQTAAHSRERVRSLRTSRRVEPARADAGGESWIDVGKQRCETFKLMGAAPHIICP
jgi:Caspase domain